MVGAVVGKVVLENIQFPSVTPQKRYYIKRTMGGNAQQIEEYLQSNYTSFGSIDTAAIVEQRDAQNMLALIQLQLPGSALSLEPVQNPQVAGYVYL